MGILDEIGKQLVIAVAPLKDAVSSTDNFKQFIYRLGWNANDIPPTYTNLIAKIDTAVSTVEALTDSPSLNEILDLFKKFRDVYDAIQSISDVPTGIGDPATFLSEIKERLFELLLIDYLADAKPFVFNLFKSLGVIDSITIPASFGRPSQVRLVLKLEELSKAFANPSIIPQRVYGWGTPDLKTEVIFNHLMELFLAIAIPVNLGQVNSDLSYKYMGLTFDDPDQPKINLQLEVPITYFNINDEDRDLGLVMYELPAVEGKLPGLIIQPNIPSEIGETLRIRDDVNFRIKGGSNIATLFGIIIRPDEISVTYPYEDGTKLPDFGFGAGIDYTPADPSILLGSVNATRLQLQGGSVDFLLNFNGGGPELIMSGDLKVLALIINTKESDSFISKILGSGESKLDMPIGVEWSSKYGIRFKGGAGLEIGLNPHITLGPLSIDLLQVRLLGEPGTPSKVKIETGASIKGDLGPLEFVIDGIGFSLNTAFGQGGNLGPLDISAGFKPPNGIGLSIDSGGMKGGGFLYLDKDKGEYAGTLELEFHGTVSLKAIGILNTKLPNGEEGFSLLIIITAEFTPIQLSFGFTLNGVGGLLGLNRTVNIELLQAGVKDGSLEYVLFPKDVVGNAPTIINAVGQIFPATEGQFIFGPMFKLGWGTPTLITLEMGLVIEVPDPVRVAILGVVKCLLPDENFKLLSLQVNFLGVIDFEKKQLSFDASLFDSRLLMYSISGDMAVRLTWGDSPNFLMTVGGFNPAYTPPPLGLGEIKRITVNLIDGNNPRIRLESYYAITSNTVQFGSKAEIYAEAWEANVYGFISFDALFQFSPFYFIAHVNGMLAVRWDGEVLFSIKLDFTLEGPTPWRARGSGSFEISFFFFDIDVSVSFDKTFGSTVNTSLPDIDVLPLLKEALNDSRNWKASIPENSHQQVSIKEIPIDDSNKDKIILHPFGVLSVSQKIVPLKLTIQKFGNQKPNDAVNEFQINKVSTSGGTSLDFDDVKEEFAPAQFFEMDNEKKLSNKSFEEYPSGASITGTNSIKIGKVAVRHVRYDFHYLEKKKLVQVMNKIRINSSLFDLFVRGSAVSKSSLSYNNVAPSPLSPKAIIVEQESFAVTYVENLKVYKENIAGSEAEANDLMRKIILENPSMTDKIQVVPSYQINQN